MSFPQCERKKIALGLTRKSVADAAEMDLQKFADRSAAKARGGFLSEFASRRDSATNHAK